MHFRYLAAALATAACVSARVLDSTPAPVSPKRDLPLNPPPNDATDPVGIKAVQDFLTATINAATPDAYLFAKTPAQWMADSVAAMVKEYPAYNAFCERCGWRTTPEQATGYNVIAINYPPNNHYGTSEYHCGVFPATNFKYLAETMGSECWAYSFHPDTCSRSDGGHGDTITCTGPPSSTS